MLSPISEFIHQVFEQLIISPDDAVATAALDNYFASNFEEINVATGAALDPAEYRKLVHSTRAQFTERKLVSDKFIIATPADDTHRSGAGAVIHVFTALEDGKRVTVTIVGVVERKIYGEAATAVVEHAAWLVEDSGSLLRLLNWTAVGRLDSAPGLNLEKSIFFISGRA
ncbi:hypothetical protein DFH06DRAFT_1308013 [Mycena polygramma]|nr:hypothetical protein DFH06DRAFT_1308013 [Mycena polygramma]